MVKITFDVSSLTQLRKEFAEFFGEALVEAAEQEHPELAAPKRRGRPRKEPTQVDLEEAISAAPTQGPGPVGAGPRHCTEILDDPIPDFLDRGKQMAAAEAKNEYTLDHIRERVRQIMDEHKKRGNAMPEVVAYVQRLFKPFGIAKAADLKPEKWADFMSTSQAYLDGTAAVS